MKTYTLAELIALKDEYLRDIDNEERHEWYCTCRELAEGELEPFLGWINLKECTP